MSDKKKKRKHKLFQKKTVYWRKLGGTKITEKSKYRA